MTKNEEGKVLKTISDIDSSHPMSIVGCVWSVSTVPEHVRLAETSGNANFLNVSTPVVEAEIKLCPDDTETFLDAIFDSPREEEFESDLQSLFCDPSGNWLTTSMTTDQALRFLNEIIKSANTHELDVALRIKTAIEMWVREYGVIEVMFSGLEKNRSVKENHTVAI